MFYKHALSSLIKWLICRLLRKEEPYWFSRSNFKVMGKFEVANKFLALCTLYFLLIMRTTFTKIWYKNFDQYYCLCKIASQSMTDKTNKATIQDIQRSIVTICIDNQFPELSDSSEEDSMGARMMLHGGGSVLNSGNRWNDKTLQVNIAWRVVGGGAVRTAWGPGWCYTGEAVSSTPVPGGTIKHSR